MRLIKIRLESFLSFQKAELSLDSRGTLLVNGDNGAGKSSLTSKAITYALFGRIPRSVKADDVVNTLCEGRSLVHLWLESGGVAYEIVRSRRPASLKLIREGEDISNRSSSETQNEINSIVGRDIDTFLSVDYFGQDQGDKFLSTTPAKQLEIFESILAIDQLDKIIDRAKSKLKKSKASADKTKSEIDSLRGEWEALTRDLSKLKQKVEIDSREINCLQAELRDYPDASVIQSQIDSSSEEEQRIKNYISSLYFKVSQLNEKLGAVEAPANLRQRVELLRDRAAQKQCNLAEVRAERLNISSPPDHRGRLALLTRMADWSPSSEELNNLYDRRSKLRESRKLNQESLCDFEEDVCPVCSQPISTDLSDKLRKEQARTEETLASIDRELALIQSRILEVEKDYYRKVGRKERLTQKKICLYNKLTEKKRIELDSRIDTIKSELDKAKADVEAEELSIREHIRSLQTNYKAQIDRIQREITGLELKSEQLSQKIKERESLKQQINLKSQELRLKRESLEAAKVDLQERQASSEEVKARGAEVSNKLKGIEQNIADLSFWVKELGRPFKSFVIRQALPVLESRANAHLQSLGCSDLQIALSATTETARGEARPVISADARSQGGRSYASLSGGERQMVDFAIGQALGELADSRSGSSSNVIILDEPFTELDAFKSRQLVDYIVGDLQLRKSTVLLLSNNEYLRSLVSSCILIERDSVGISRITNV